MTDVRSGRLGRRQLLSLAVATAALPLTACEDVPVRPTAERPGEPEVDPDEALLDVAVRLESAMLGALAPLLRASSGSVRRLARQTAGTHQAHLDLLGGEVEAAAPGGGPRTTLRSPQEVRDAQDALSRRHAELAVRAESGQFARVLAGMSASSAQLAAVWAEAAERSGS